MAFHYKEVTNLRKRYKPIDKYNLISIIYNTVRSFQLNSSHFSNVSSLTPNGNKDQSLAYGNNKWIFIDVILYFGWC